MSRLSFTAPCLGLFVAGAMIADARASDLTVTSTFSNAAEYSDNYFLRSGPSSGVLGTYSTLSLLAIQRTPTTSLEFGGNLSYKKYFGPGASQLASTENTSDGLHIRFEKSGQLQANKDFIGASYQRSDAVLAQRADVGVAAANVSGDINTYSVNGGGSRQISALDSINWNANATSTTFSPAGSGTGFSNYLAGGSWNRRLTETLDFVASSDITLLKYDDTAQTRTTIFRTTGGIRSRLSGRLTFRANAGINVVKTTQEHPSATAVVTAFDPITGLPLAVAPPASAGATVGPVWDVGLTYAVTPTTDLDLNASQSVTPGVIGSLSTRTSASANLSHRVNSKSSLNFAVSATHFDQGSTSPTSDLYAASASYDYRISRDWRASLLYTYRLRNLSDTPTLSGSSGHANSVLFTLTQDATLKP